MQKYKYTITFYDYWQTGSGQGAGAKADSLCVKTKDGLPFVSGKSIKGLLSDFILNKEIKSNCFGKEGVKKGVKDPIVSIFDNALLPQAEEILKHGFKNELYDYITTTKIEDGIAKSNSLRAKEVTVPLTLEGEIELSDECKPKIVEAMQQLKRLGSGRNRGFGRCDIVLNSVISESTSRKFVVDKESIMLKCIFKGDVVLSGSSNTEGKKEVLDFIPGSAILGVIASGVNNNKLNIEFENLLNGNICFKEGTLLKGKTIAYSMPFTFFKPKIAKADDKNSSKIYNFPYIADDDHKKYQMKQQRIGYITEDGEILNVEYNYQQKSSHNKEERRSEEGGMYGYTAITKGTEFALEITANEHLSEIVNYLCNGTHRLGKSKSAQYGKVIFEVLEDIEKVQYTKPIEQDNLTFLYAKSRLALYHETGLPTYEPTIKNLGLSSGKILWEYSQIRTSSFTPYNGVQRTATYERLVIERGSVIVIENCKDNLLNSMQVGAYQNEGFGEILVNPSFLSEKFFDYSEEENSISTKSYPEYKGTDTLLCYLKQKKQKKADEYLIVKYVDEVENSLQGITNSQWGTIRSIVVKPTSSDIKTEIESYISSGKSKDIWQKGNKKNTLLYKIEEIETEQLKRKFVKYLAMRMQSKGGES